MRTGTPGPTRRRSSPAARPRCLACARQPHAWRAVHRCWRVTPGLGARGRRGLKPFILAPANQRCVPNTPVPSRQMPQRHDISTEKRGAQRPKQTHIASCFCRPRPILGLGAEALRENIWLRQEGRMAQEIRRQRTSSPSRNTNKRKILLSLIRNRLPPRVIFRPTQPITSNVPVVQLMQRAGKHLLECCQVWFCSVISCHLRDGRTTGFL